MFTRDNNHSFLPIVYPPITPAIAHYLYERFASHGMLQIMVG